MLEIVPKIMIGLNLSIDMALILLYGLYLVGDTDKYTALTMIKYHSLDQIV